MPPKGKGKESESEDVGFYKKTTSPSEGDNDRLNLPRDVVTNLLKKHLVGDVLNHISNLVGEFELDIVGHKNKEMTMRAKTFKRDKGLDILIFNFWTRFGTSHGFKVVVLSSSGPKMVKASCLEVGQGLLEFFLPTLQRLPILFEKQFEFNEMKARINDTDDASEIFIEFFGDSSIAVKIEMEYDIFLF